jgi:hypothetical protein
MTTVRRLPRTTGVFIAASAIELHLNVSFPLQFMRFSFFPPFWFVFESKHQLKPLRPALYFHFTRATFISMIAPWNEFFFRNCNSIFAAVCMKVFPPFSHAVPYCI